MVQNDPSAFIENHFAFGLAGQSGGGNPAQECGRY